MADHAWNHALSRFAVAKLPLAQNPPPSARRARNGTAAGRARRFSATDANATLMPSLAAAPATATIAKCAMQTYIDCIRDLA
jgi:hypothetical protein